MKVIVTYKAWIQYAGDVCCRYDYYVVVKYKTTIHTKRYRGKVRVGFDIDDSTGQLFLYETDENIIMFFKELITKNIEEKLSTKKWHAHVATSEKLIENRVSQFASKHPTLEIEIKEELLK